MRYARNEQAQTSSTSALKLSGEYLRSGTAAASCWFRRPPRAPDVVPGSPAVWRASLRPIPWPLRSLHENAVHLSHDREHADKDRKSTRLNSSHVRISYAVFCLKKK